MTGDGRFQKGHGVGRKTEWIQKVCPKCEKKFEVKPSLARVICCSRRCASTGKTLFKGYKHSPETVAKMRAAKLGIRGEDHWNYRGGKRSERSKAMARDEYKQWRAAVFKRDDFTCQDCGDRGVELHADHIKPWASHPAHRFEINNGRTLCVPCHWKTASFPKKLIPKKELQIGR